MKTVDFARSFFTFRIDTLKKPPITASHKPPFTLNNARIPLDCILTVKDKSVGSQYRYVLGADCKTERVGVDKDIWTEPNADFVPIVSGDSFLIIKTFDSLGKKVMLFPPSKGEQPDRQVGSVEEAYDDLRIDVIREEGKILNSNEEIVRAVLDNRVLVGITELENDRYTAVLEFPVKTINANERDFVYQPDTGPVLFPDLTRDPQRLIEGFELAFIAFNCSEWVEFIVRVPTKVNNEVSVYHYSKAVHLNSKNTIMQLL